MTELTAENFDKWIRRKRMALVLFYWDYCKPCKAMKSELEKLPKSMNVGIIDVNKELSITQRYTVVKLPCVLLFKNGKLADKLTGYHPIAEIKEWLNQ